MRLPEDVIGLTHITTLNISENRLEELDERIGKLRKLTDLSV